VKGICSEVVEVMSGELVPVAPEPRSDGDPCESPRLPGSVRGAEDVVEATVRDALRVTRYTSKRPMLAEPCQVKRLERTRDPTAVPTCQRPKRPKSGLSTS
jgi:hypothetical protein